MMIDDSCVFLFYMIRTHLTQQLLDASRFQISPVVLVIICQLIVDINWSGNVFREFKFDLKKRNGDELDVFY